MENITVRSGYLRNLRIVSNADPRPARRIKAADNAAFGA
jgi:hypothetical protein